jgi:enoyl-[acyl-carrier protein] reductase II
MSKLDNLWSKGTKFLGSKYAVIGGAMSWVSENNLVSAMSNAGMFGVLAGGSMSPDLLKQEIQKVKQKTKNSFGVNLIVMHPQLDALIDVCIEEKITHVIFAAGLISSNIIEKLKSNNIKVVAFAPNLSLAKRMVKNGIDALVIEGSEAGGHIGPVSTSILVQEILPHITEVPVFVAGGIGRGEVIANYLNLGASGVQIGTAFVCSTECVAHENFKQAFIHAAAKDAQPSVQVDPTFPVIPVRAIFNKASNDFILYQHEVIKEFKAGGLAKLDAQLKIEHFWAGALRKAVVDGDVINGSLMAGQSVGMVEKIEPLADILARLINQTEEFLSK